MSVNLVYAGLLLHSAGKPIDEAGVTKVAEATGEKIEPAQVKALIAALDGVNVEEAISKAAAPVAVSAAPVNAEKKDEKPIESAEDQEKKAESAAEGLGALFG